MYLSLDWLKDFVDIPKSITPENLGERLTMHTVEIDGVEKQSDKFDKVVVGKILEINQHPNADRLRLARVDVGNEELGIVCGAPNIEVGQLVPVALVGAVLPGDFEIREAEVRGEKSCGMMCAEDELGLGDDHDGIMVLDKKAKVGQAFGEYLKMDDVVFEVDNKSITNRPDLWGHFGMSREIAAFLDTKLKKNITEKKVEDLKIEGEEKVSVNVEDYKLCPRYMAVKVDGIKIEDSPKWMQDRLIAADIRPINNIVDITNYVMLELGQPMHAFDGNKIQDIVIRKAKNGEKLETLDGQERELNNANLVIADSEKAIAIAGVMGGEVSEIDNDTTSLVLEVANFDAISIRKTSQELGLRTDASMRFEKVLDPNLCEISLVRAVELIKQLCNEAKVVSGVVDKKEFDINQGPIELDLNWLYEYIGEDIGDKTVEKILISLGFGIEQSEKILQVTIPTWRATKDISIREDLAEEVMRIYGYDKINPQMPKIEMKPSQENKKRKLETVIKEILSSAPALTEVSNYSFVGEDQLKKLGIDYSTHVRLVNPISNHHTMLRQSLVPNLLGNIKTNQARYDDFGLFEIGSICLDIPSGPMKDVDSGENLPYQEKRLGVLIVGDKKDDVFNKAKGILEYLFSKLGVALTIQVTEMHPNWSDKQYGAQIESNGKNLGSIYAIDKDISKKVGAKKEAAVFEVSLSELFEVLPAEDKSSYQAYGKYPPLTRDLAFVVSEKVLYSDIYKEISEFNEYVSQVELFDVYQGEKLGKGMKSLAFHVVYQANKTLTSTEVDEMQEGLLKRMEEKFEAKIRDF